MVPDKFNMVDMGGIDLIMMQGEEVPGLYNRLVESIAQCRYQCLYNWLFDGVIIPPTYVELEVNEDDEVAINEGVTVSDDDVIHIYSIEPPAPEPEIIPLLAEENGVYDAPTGVDGFSPVTVDVPSYTPIITPLSVTENGTYTAPSGVDGYSPVTVDVPSGSAIWHDSFSINWGFSNPVNTRGQTQYRSSSLIYSLDGWQLQGGQLDIVSGGIKLSRYSSGTAGFFMQKYKNIPTSAMVGKTCTLSGMVDGTVGYRTAAFPSSSSGTSGVSIGGVTFRIWNYGTEAAVTIDIGTDTGSHVVQAVKLEMGSMQTLATQVNGVWVLNQQMDYDTEIVKIGMGLVYNS